MICEKCGAIKCELGQEPTLALYLDHLLLVFEAVWRVLRDDGCAFVNMGDSYAGGGGYSPNSPSNLNGSMQGEKSHYSGDQRWVKGKRTPDGLKAKDLMLIPHRFAIRMQEAGWYVRNDLVWNKTSCMPESVTDRATRCHEYIFHFSKKATYYYDAEAVKEALKDDPETYLAKMGNKAHGVGTFQEVGAGRKAGGFNDYKSREGYVPNGRNQRTVWTISPEPLDEPHFASFPSEIPRRAILAATSERGCCAVCGAAYRRVVETPSVPDGIRHRDNGAKMDFHTRSVGGGQNVQDWRDRNPARTTGWSPSCQCNAGDPVPQTVLDPFLGSGRTAVVARALGRHCIGIDLSPEYMKMIRRQTAQQSLGLGVSG